LRRRIEETILRLTDATGQLGGPDNDMKVITSLQNRRVKYLRSLRLRKYRQRERQYMIEGLRIVEEALDRGAPVETLIYAPDLLVSERAEPLVMAVEPDRRLAVSEQVFRSLSERDDPQGLAAVVRIEEPDLQALAVGEDLLLIVACELQDPGNLGSIVRTADAVGASGVVIVEPSVDLYDPQCVRATMGSLFALPIAHLTDSKKLLAWWTELRRQQPRLAVVASSAHGAIDHFDVDYRRPTILLVGNERRGLPEDMREACDVLVRLPMVGSATSLNVSAATAALAYEIVRQRRNRPRDKT